MADYNYTEATDTLAKQKLGNEALLASQSGQENDYLTRYRGAIAGQETSANMARRIGAELNLPTLSENAFNLNRQVRELPQTYSAATRGFDVNANQLNRIVGQKTSELTPALTTANEALANANQTLATQMGYQLSDQEKSLLPYTTEKELLTNKLARETSLYTSQNENELSTIISKIQSGIAVSEAEKARALQLATQEQNYNLEKEKLNATLGQGTIETIGGNKYLVNKTTGEKIFLGSATSGSGSGSGNVLDYLKNYLNNPSTSPINPPASSFVPDMNSEVTGNLNINPTLMDTINGNMNFSNVDLSNITGNNAGNNTNNGLYLVR